jgi:hypothetical protein
MDYYSRILSRSIYFSPSLPLFGREKKEEENDDGERKKDWGRSHEFCLFFFLDFHFHFTFFFFFFSSSSSSLPSHSIAFFRPSYILSLSPSEMKEETKRRRKGRRKGRKKRKKR